MNQRLSTQVLTNIVGATLAVALVKHESAFEHTGTDMNIPNQDREFVPFVGAGEVDERCGGACAALGAPPCGSITACGW